MRIWPRISSQPPDQLARRSHSSRGQGSVIGVVLIFGITVLAVTAIMAAGSFALQANQDTSEIDRASLAMTQFDSQAALVALGDSERQRSAISLTGRGSSLVVLDDAGWMNITIQNETSGATESTLMNITMGAVVYENDAVTIAYQGGGVWRKESGGSVMVSPPEFHYRTSGGQDPTLTLPLVVVRGSASPGQDLVVEQAATTGKYPVSGDPDRSNPLTEGEIVITLRSVYYQAWGSFFEQRTGGSVTYFDTNETVEITLDIQTSTPGVQGGIVSGASGGSLTFDNQAEADSYNSDVGPYSTSSGSNTSIVTEGDVELNNQAKLFGDLVTGGSVSMQNQAEIDGNLSYGGTLSMDGGATVTGTIDDDASVDPLDPVDWLIDDRRAEFQSSNDNAANADVNETTNTLNSSVTTWELTALGGDGGQYFLTEIDFDNNNDELIINTTDGDVEVVVTGNIDLQGESKLRVTGPNVARFYVEKSFRADNKANFSVPGDKSPQLWFYMNPGETASFRNQAKFVGVIYGPGSGAQQGVEITLDNQAIIKGGLVGQVPSVNNGIELHFDEALSDETPVPGGTGKPPITYLHITVNEVNVTEG